MMKKLLMVVFILCSIKGLAQEKGYEISFDTTKMVIFHSYRYMFRNSTVEPVSMLTVDDKGNVEITGDTILIIKDILRYYEQKDSIINALKEGIHKAVIVTNHIPDNIKKESETCGWNAYQKFLRKIGYEVITLKKGQISPCN